MTTSARCQQCSYQIGGVYRCSNRASCRLGCILYCWVHAATHGIKQACNDMEVLTDSDDLTEVLERLQAHSQQLRVLREQVNGMNIPIEKLHQLQLQLNEMNRLLYD